MTESGDDAVMNPPNELSQMMANSIGASVLALGGMVPAFTGDGGGPSAEDFLEVLVQVGKMGGWNDLQLMGIGRCKMIGKAYNFAWHDEELKGAKTFKEFKNLVLARYDNEPLSAKMEKFLTARQERGEDVREFSSRLTALGKRTLIPDSNSDVATYTGMNFLEVQLLARYTNGLRDPIRRFVLSHDPKTFKEAVEIATREERNESIVADNQPVRALREESDQVEDLRLRLDRLEKMLADSLALHHWPEPVEGLSMRRNHPRGCFLCDVVGHFVRERPFRVSQGQEGTELSLPERSCQTFPKQVANQGN